MPNYTTEVATNVFPTGSIMVRRFVVCAVAGSFSASLQLANDCMALMSNIANTENLWVLIGKYKRPCYVVMLLNSGLSTFPNYLISTGYISFAVPYPGSCLGY